MSNFQSIDMQTWPMAQAFHYYTQIAPTSYTVNVTMDVTILRKELKRRGYKFYPAYPQFHEDDKTTSLLWTEYHGDFEIFYSRYLDDTKLHGQSHGILSSKGLPPANAYIISCIPWFTFNSFSLHNHGIKDYYVPSFEAGGFAETGNGQIAMPLSVTVHHAVTDGYHLKVFFEELQRAMNNPDGWL